MTPSQLKNLTPADAEALKRLDAIKAARAVAAPPPGSPGFIGPPRPPAPAPQGLLSRTAGVVGRGLGSVGKALSTGRALTGAGGLLYSPEASAGTLDSPEAQWAIAENIRIRRERGDPVVAGEPNEGFVNSPVIPTIPPTPSPNTTPLFPGSNIARTTTAIGQPVGGISPMEPDVTTLQNFRTGNYTQTQQDVIAAQDRLARAPQSDILRQSLTNAERMNEAARQAKMESEGPLERRTYENSQGTLSGVVPVGRGQGGFVGAATDAEATRNLQARFEQDAAARGIAANTDQAIERMRDLRAEKMGISRSALDASEGRGGGGEQGIVGVKDNPFAMPGDSFGDDVLRRDRLIRTIENPSGRTRKERESQREAALGTLATFMRGNQPTRTQASPGVDPVDMQRFLLDQQKFGWQQGIDKGRLQLDAEKAKGEQAGRQFEQQKYTDEQRKAFISDFTFSDKNAPREQIAADVFEISRATGGVVPPEIVARYYEQAVKELGIDYKKGGPKNPKELNEKVAALIARDYQGN